MFKINPPQNTRGESSQLQEGEEEDESGDNITTEEPTMVGNGATVRGQSQLGNNPTVQGLGLRQTVRKGIRNSVRAGVKAATDVVDAAADSATATVEGQGFFSQVFSDNIRNKVQNARDRFRQVTGLKQSTGENGQNQVSTQQEEDNTEPDSTMGDLTLPGNSATVQGQSLRGNGPTVQGQGIFKNIRRNFNKAAGAIADGVAEAAGAVGNFTVDIVDAAAPDTVNPTLTINNNINGVSVGGG